MDIRIKKLIASVLMLALFIDSAGFSCVFEKTVFGAEQNFTEIEEIIDTEKDSIEDEEIQIESIDEAEEILTGDETPDKIYPNVGDGGMIAYLTGDTLTFSGVGKMKNWTNFVDVPWYEDRRSINNIVIPGGITTIGEQAFKETSITSIDIPDTVTEINTGAFLFCNKLSTVTMPITAKVTDNAFVDTEPSVFTLFSLIKGADGTKTVNYTEVSAKKLPWNKMPDTATIDIATDIEEIGEYTFYKAKAIKNIRLENVSKIGKSAFEGCTGFSDLYLDNSTVSIEIGDRAFKECKDMDNVTVPISIIPNADAFAGCEKLARIDLLSGTGIGTDYSMDTYINTPWYVADKINGKSNVIQSIDSSITKFGNYTFAYCENITTLPTLGSDVDKLGKGMLLGCKKLTEFKIPDKVLNIENEVFADCNALSKLTLHKNIKTIGNYSFRECDGLISFKVPEETLQMNETTFFGCDNITALTYERVLEEYKWYRTTDYKDNTYYDLAANLTKATKDIKIYLKPYKDEPVVDPVYYHVYLRYGDNLISDNKLLKEDGVDLYFSDPGTPTAPRSGVSFEGWYEDKEFKTKVVFPLKLENEKTDIYSKWDCLHEDTKIVITKQPTCVEKGLCDIVCTFPACGAIVIKDKEIDPTDHEIIECVIEEYEKNPANFEVFEEPTLSSKGKAHPKCKKCREFTDITQTLVLPELFSDEAVHKVSDTEYTVNIVKGTTVTIPAIAKAPTDVKWVAKFEELKIACVSTKGEITAEKYGRVDLNVRRYSVYSKVESECKYTDYAIHIKVTDPAFSEKKYFIKTGDELNLDDIYVNVGKGNTKLDKEIKIKDEKIVAYNDGTFTGLKYGNTVVEVYILNKFCGSCRIYVDDPHMSDATVSILNGKGYQLRVSGTNSKIKWSSSDESIATVTNKGKVKPVSTGTVTITAKLEKFGDAEISAVVYVDKPVLTPSYEVLMLDEDKDIKKSYTIAVTKTSGEATDWKTTNKFAEVSDTGEVTGLKAGTSTITCIINKIKHKCTVKVCDPVIAGAKAVKRRKRTKFTVKQVIKDSEIEWSSSDISIAVVSPDGTVIGIGKGVANISATVSVVNSKGEKLTRVVSKEIEVK